MIHKRIKCAIEVIFVKIRLQNKFYYCGGPFGWKRQDSLFSYYSGYVNKKEVSAVA